MQIENRLIAHTESKHGKVHGVSYDNLSRPPAQSPVNLNQIERILSAVGGGLLFKRNFGRFSLSGLLKTIAGGALMRRGITGHCNLYETMNINSAAQQHEQSQPGATVKALPIRAEITVQMTPSDTYELWRDPANQRWIMGHFAKMDSISTDRAHWTLRSPVGMKQEWDALIVADSPGEFIRWESLPGAGLPNEGTVRFMPTETGGTRLIFEALYDPPAGALGMALMKLIGVTPESMIGKALLRFKYMAEMGMPNTPAGTGKMTTKSKNPARPAMA